MFPLRNKINNTLEIYDILNESWLSSDFNGFCHNVSTTHLERSAHEDPLNHEATMFYYFDDKTQGERLSTDYGASEQVANNFHILNDINNLLAKPKYPSILYKTALSHTFCQFSEINELIEIPPIVKYQKSFNFDKVEDFLGYTFAETQEKNDFILNKLNEIIDNKPQKEVQDPYRNIRNLIFEKVLDSLIYYNPFHKYEFFESTKYKDPYTNENIKKEIMYIIRNDPHALYGLGYPQQIEYNKLKLIEAKEAYTEMLRNTSDYDTNYSQKLEERMHAFDKAQKDYALLRKSDLVYDEYVTKLEENERNSPLSKLLSAK